MFIYRLPFIAILLIGSPALFEDSIFLKGSSKEVKAKVTELTPGHVTAIISKEEIASIYYSRHSNEWCDAVSFGPSEVGCKIVALGERTMVLEFPKEEIASFFVKERALTSTKLDRQNFRGRRGSNQK
jgi:hypothetical protein